MSEREQDQAIEIRSRDDLKAFLEVRPSDVSVTIAVRTALRVFPLVADVENSVLRTGLILSMFRATLVAQRRQYASTAAYAADAAAYAADVATAVYAADAAHAADASPAFGGFASSAVYAAYAASAASASAAAAYTASAAFAASAAALTTTTADDDASSFWAQLNFDCALIHNGGPAHLQKPVLWQKQPAWFISKHAKFERILLKQGGSWPLLETWYDQMIENASIDPFPIQALDEIANESPEFWGDGDDNPRTPGVVMDEIAERLGWSPKDQTTDNYPEAETELLEQRPAPHTYTYNHGKIDTSGVSDLRSDAIGEAIYTEVKEKALQAQTAAGGNTGDAKLAATLNRFLEMLGDNLNDVNPGKALMSARTIQADISAFEAQGASDKLLAQALSALRDLNGSLEDFLGIFPEIQSINANALALKIQDSDVEAIRALDAEIEAIAQQSDAVSDTAKAALTDGGADVDSALEAKASATSETRIAQALEAAAKTMSVKLLSTRNFIAASVRTSMELTGKGAKGLGKAVGEYVKDAGGRAREGSLDAIGASAKGLTTAGIATLVGMLTTPIVGMAVYVASFRGLKQKAEKVVEDKDEADG